MGQEGEHGDQPRQGQEFSNRSTLREMQQMESGRELAGFIERAGTLQLDLSQAADKQPSDSLDISGELPIEPTLRERYTSAQFLMSGVLAILRDEIGGDPGLANNPGYLAGQLDLAIAPLGLKVKVDEESEAKKYRLRTRGFRRLERARLRGAPNRDIADDGTHGSITSPHDEGGSGTRR